MVCLSVAMGWKTLDAGYEDMLQRDCLSFRAFSDIRVCAAGQILQIYTLIRRSMVYGILSIQILEDVQVSTDGAGLGRGNRNRLNRWIGLYGLYL